MILPPKPAASGEALRPTPQPASLRRISPAIASENLLASPRYRVYQFHSAILPEDRQVIVYVPTQYDAEPDRRFPVFFLHDGQNLFDGRTSFVADCTWRAHTTADHLTAANVIEPVILVGIANAGMRRMAEYTPTRDPRMGGGEGPLYGRLLMQELKPILDAAYRTRPGPADTAVGGSSLGGLISLFLGMEHPEVFGKIAVVSPSLWWHQRKLLDRIYNLQPGPRLRMWLDMGTAEGFGHLRDTDQLHRMLLSFGWKENVDIRYLRVDGAAHDESAWAARFGDILRFLFPS